MHGHGKLATIDDDGIQHAIGSPALLVGYLDGVDSAVEQRRHGVAAHPDVRLHREPLELCLHLRCLHAQPDYDPYMSIRSQQHNLIIMSATCIHEHRQFRSIMMHGYISKSFSFWMEIFYFYQFRESTPSFVKLLA